VAEG